MMQPELVNFQFSASTAEDERNYFTGSEPVVELDAAPNGTLPEGTYRVIDGELCLIMSGVPASL